jgi:hypothetical protein
MNAHRNPSKWSEQYSAHRKVAHIETASPCSKKDASKIDNPNRQDNNSRNQGCFKLSSATRVK